MCQSVQLWLEWVEVCGPMPKKSNVDRVSEHEVHVWKLPAQDMAATAPLPARLGAGETRNSWQQGH